MTVLFSSLTCAQTSTAQESVDAITGELSAQVTLHCPYDQRWAVADDIIGNRREYPLIASTVKPRAYRATITGLDAINAIDGQAQAPKTAALTIYYQLSQVTTAGPFSLVTESVEPLGEFRKLNYQLFRFGSRSGRALTPEETPGKFESKLRIVRRIHKLAALPPTALTLYGRTNGTAYTSPCLGFTFGVETLLYDTPQSELTRLSDGSSGFNLTQNWMWNPRGWNQFYDPELDVWGNIYHIGSNDPFKPYPPADMSTIL